MNNHGDFAPLLPAKHTSHSDTIGADWHLPVVAMSITAAANNPPVEDPGGLTFLRLAFRRTLQRPAR
jgi:hypothetical protein